MHPTTYSVKILKKCKKLFYLKIIENEKKKFSKNYQNYTGDSFGHPISYFIDISEKNIKQNFTANE